MIEIEWPVSQKICELKMLQKFFSDRGILFKYILEIGTFFGGTTLLWAKLVEPHGIVYSLDLIHRQNSVYKGSPWEKYILEIDGDSHSQTVKKNIRRIFGNYHEEIDMLFIDGDHSYAGVSEDFYTYSVLVREGGWVVIHDIRDTEFHRNLAPPDGPVEVYKFWDEIKKKYRSWELLDPDDDTFMGIGVITL